MTTTPHAIVANWRLTTAWTIEGLPHVARQYITEIVNNAGAWYAVKNGAPSTQLAWTDIADYQANAFQKLGETGQVFGVSLLEYRNGLVWELLDTHSPTITATGGTPFTWSGNQMTITLRDSSLNRFKIVIEEANEAQNFTNKSIGYGQAQTLFMVNNLVNPAQDDFAAANWMCSKYAIPVKPMGFVSWATYPNRKVLRARGRK